MSVKISQLSTLTNPARDDVAPVVDTNEAATRKMTLDGIARMAVVLLTSSAGGTIDAIYRAPVILWLYTGTGGHTLTLPAIASAGTTLIIVKNAGSGDLTVEPDAANTIEGAPHVLAAGASLMLFAGGLLTEWVQVTL